MEVEVKFKEEKFPYYEDKDLRVTGIGDMVKGRIVYVSSKFVKEVDGKKVIEFKRVNAFMLMLENARFMVTAKGTYVIKFEPNSVMYVIEVPSGFRGSVHTKIIRGECYQTEVLRSPRGSIGVVEHLYCNGDAEIEYDISGRTRTTGYSALIDYFGEQLKGKIVISGGNVRVVSDDELEKIL